MQRFFIAALIGTLLGSVATAAPAPNILMIVADDLGYGDLGCTGSTTIRTPNIDQMAAQGVLCSRGYVTSSVCSPSRAGLITGRDPRRFGYEGNLNQSETNYPTQPDLLGLPPTEWTLADHLKAAGYATGLVGKWHLGDRAPFHPNRRGFGHFCGMLNGGHDYFPLKNGSHIERNGNLVEEFSSPYLTDFFTDEAIRWINEQNVRKERTPWMLYLSYNAPHTPMQATADDLADYPQIANKKRRTYAAMVQALDRGVGRVLKQLDELGERENTLVVFLSDNGGPTQNASWNGQLSGTKGTLREGGIRVPLIWNWPGQLPVNETCNAPISALDFLPTFLAAAKAEPLPLQDPPTYVDKQNRRRMIERHGPYDGRNVLPTLRGDEPDQPRELFWRLQGQAAMLTGSDKVVRLNHRLPQLFQPGGDPGEQSDQFLSDSQRGERLLRRLADWEACLPTVPLWDSSPYWWSDSARKYDEYPPRPEPQ